VREASVVAHGLALGGLVFLAEVAAARLVALERVMAHELGELEKVRHAPRLLEILIERVGAAGHARARPELVAQLRDLLERRAQTRGASGHAAVVPHDLAEATMELVDRGVTLQRHELL